MEALLKRLTPVKAQVNAQFLLSFIDELLPEIINHRNMLKLHRSVNAEFKNLFSSAVMDVDFSENLALGIKWEPQFLHWVKRQMTVHSGIVKCRGRPTIPTLVMIALNQSFMKVSIEVMMQNNELHDGPVIIESDNCSSQYKSSQHFLDIQDITNTLGRQIIRLYRVAGHGKGEVDNVWGVVKVAVRKEMARGTYFPNAVEVVSFLQEKFGEKTFPQYNIREITADDLAHLRKSAAKKVFPTTPGSSSFHVIIF